MKTQNNYLQSKLPIDQISCAPVANHHLGCKSSSKMQEIYTSPGEEREPALLFLDILNYVSPKDIMLMRKPFQTQSQIDDMDLNYYLSISG